VSTLYSQSGLCEEREVPHSRMLWARERLSRKTICREQGWGMETARKRVT